MGKHLRLSYLHGIIINVVREKLSGGDSKEVTPVPMPNTVVKLFCADGSWGLPPVRVGRCRAIFSEYETNKLDILTHSDAGWSSLAARRAHNPKVGGSNPPPAIPKNRNEVVSVFLFVHFFAG